MKNIFLTCALLVSSIGFAQSRDVSGGLQDDLPLPVGSELMSQVRAQLPPMPLELRGKIWTYQNRNTRDRRLVSVLRFGDAVPTATYTLSDSFGDLLSKVQVRWSRGIPEYFQWDAEGNAMPAPAPQGDVADTGLTWSDLSLDFLWWPGAKASGREIVKTRSSVVLFLPAPPEREDLHQIKLWVDERALFIVRAEMLDADGKLLKRIEAESFKKVREDFWMVKDLKVYDPISKSRMGIRFEEVIELEESLSAVPADKEVE
ncbi:outer membrane lipoprotein-sorting protein [Kiritimatiellaeota bacterium B1221]|nr:outer membrane lipoprotein-sorting protein [Kiritimatiellaeota bacterium B1221]